MSDYQITVYMDRRDITPWVQHCSVEINNSSHRSFSLNLKAWHSYDWTNRWDIYASFDGTNPRAELLISQGVVPPDRQRIVHIGKGQVPYLVVQGYDWVWLTKRKAPPETIILVPGNNNVEADVQLAIANHGKPIGEYRVWRGIDTLHTACRRLATAAGIRVAMNMPNYDFAAWVVPPELSYWKAIEKLTNPYAPVRYFNRWNSTLVVQDQAMPIMGAGNRLVLGEEVFKVMDVQPTGWTTPRRVMLRVPPWR